MKTAYRTLVLKYNVLLLPSGSAEKIPTLLILQEAFRQWATEWVRGRAPLPQNNPLKYFASRFLYASRAYKGVKKNAKVRKMRVPLFFDAQLRLDKERDMGRGVFVNIPRGELRIRKWSRGNTIVLPLSRSTKWILERVKEGGKLVFVAVWIGASRRNRAAKLYVALTFRREVRKPMEAKRLLIIDFNALHNGISYAVVEGERIVVKGTWRPNTSKILRLQKVASRLDRICAKKDKACEEAMAARSRIWRLLRVWEDEAAKKLLQLAAQYRAVIVIDLPRDESMRKLKEGGYAAEKKIFLNFGRLRNRLRGLALWYGIPYIEKRLYSTVCPRCGRKMEKLPDRRVRCVCGFEAHRDEVPVYWAMRLYPQLSSFSSPLPAWAGLVAPPASVACRS
jgi:putative transposase